MASQKLSISDVARAAGVSKATVGFALSNRTDVRVAAGTRARVQEVARQIGYRRSGVATALSVGRIYTVGVVIQSDDRTPHGINVYARDVIAALTWACSQQNLRVTTILARKGYEITAEELADGRVDGLVLVSSGDRELVHTLFATGFPTVSIGSGYSECRIVLDNAAGLREAMAHLIDLGHRDIAFVDYERKRALNSAAGERRATYCDAIQALGSAPRIFELEQAIAFLEARLMPRPSAWMCFNDLVACSILQTAERLGQRVPKDMSVVGFDDSLSARMACPPLTTVTNPIDEQAELALSVLQSLWRETEAPPLLPVTPRLVVRKSTGPPPSK